MSSPKFQIHSFPNQGEKDDLKSRVKALSKLNVQMNVLASRSATSTTAATAVVESQLTAAQKEMKVFQEMITKTHAAAVLGEFWRELATMAILLLPLLCWIAVITASLKKTPCTMQFASKPTQEITKKKPRARDIYKNKITTTKTTQPTHHNQHCT